MSRVHKAYFESPIGLLEVIGSDDAITAVNFVERESMEIPDPPPHLSECLEQLDQYFQGRCKQFDLSLKPNGTVFQQQVWRQLIHIPFGETSTYADVAAAIGKERAVRAVGHANGRNPIAVIIPCHRVIGSNGKLTGYGGGLWRKAWLLEHERQHQQLF